MVSEKGARASVVAGPWVQKRAPRSIRFLDAEWERIAEFADRRAIAAAEFVRFVAPVAVEVGSEACIRLAQQIGMTFRAPHIMVTKLRGEMLDAVGSRNWTNWSRRPADCRTRCRDGWDDTDRVMKVTVEFDDHPARAAEAYAAEKGETLGRLIERVLNNHVQGERAATSSMALLTKGSRPVPGVDIDNRPALYDLMDARD